MPVTFRREYYLECERFDELCNEVLMLDQADLSYKRPTPKSFKRLAVKVGWKIEGNKCWCPTCKKKMDDLVRK